jgi:UDP-N-acetylmuramyl pentapeptide synthase
MPTLTFSQLADMIGGTVVQGGDVISSTVVIDSRVVKDDSVFFAIKGERLDGHEFLSQALTTARGAVVSDLPDVGASSTADRRLPTADNAGWRAPSASGMTFFSSASPARLERRPRKR